MSSVINEWSQRSTFQASDFELHHTMPLDRHCVTPRDESWKEHGVNKGTEKSLRNKQVQIQDRIRVSACQVAEYTAYSLVVNEPPNGFCST